MFPVKISARTLPELDQLLENVEREGASAGLRVVAVTLDPDAVFAAVLMTATGGRKRGTDPIAVANCISTTVAPLWHDRNGTGGVRVMARACAATRPALVAPSNIARMPLAVV